MTSGKFAGDTIVLADGTIDGDANACFTLAGITGGTLAATVTFES